MYQDKLVRMEQDRRAEEEHDRRIAAATARLDSYAERNGINEQAEAHHQRNERMDFDAHNKRTNSRLDAIEKRLDAMEKGSHGTALEQAGADASMQGDARNMARAEQFHAEQEAKADEERGLEADDTSGSADSAGAAAARADRTSEAAADTDLSTTAGDADGQRPVEPESAEQDDKARGRKARK